MRCWRSRRVSTSCPGTSRGDVGAGGYLAGCGERTHFRAGVPIRGARFFAVRAVRNPWPCVRSSSLSLSVTSRAIAVAEADRRSVAAERRYERARARWGLGAHNGTRTWEEQHAVDVEENPGADFDELERLYDAAEAASLIAHQAFERQRQRSAFIQVSAPSRSRERHRARPRERRPARRRRASSSRAGPDDDLSDPDGEGPNVGGRRRRGWAS